MVIKNTNYTKQEIQRMLEAGSRRELSVSEKKLLEISSKIYLFDEISKEDIIRITKNVKFRRHKKGDIIMNEGDKSEEIYFILYGLGVVVVDNKKIVATIESGSMFGEMAFLTKKPRNATILAHTEGTTVISFEINEEKCTELYSYPFAKLYRNISLDLTHKIELSNKRNTTT
ncbi:cyclic nucleotide-binding domain-containing protein [Sulfurospirillum sp. 1307]|jgi:CRP-like cAMP-binding protein